MVNARGQTGDEGTAALGADGGAQTRPGPPATQVFFHTIEVGDVAEDPAGGAGSLLEGFMELAPGVRPASGKDDFSRTAHGEGGVGAVAIALQGAAEVGGDEVIQTGGGTAGLPVKEHVAAWPAIGPEVALPGFAIARFKIADGGLPAPSGAALRAKAPPFGFLAPLDSSTCT